MPSSCWEWEAELNAAEALLHNQSNEASLEDELELLPAAAEQASEELLPSDSVQGVAEGGVQRVEQLHIPSAPSFTNHSKH